MNQKTPSRPNVKKEKGVEVFCGICGQRHGANEPHKIQTLSTFERPSPISRIVANKSKPPPAGRVLGGIQIGLQRKKIKTVTA